MAKIILTEFKTSIKIIFYFMMSIYYVSLYNVLSVIGLLNKFYYKRKFLSLSKPVLLQHFYYQDILNLKIDNKLKSMQQIKNGFLPVQKLTTLDFFYNKKFRDYF